MSCHRLLYVSKSVVDGLAAKGAVARILLASYRNNEQRAVTGALAYTGSHFAQVLEGDQRVVETLYETIERDPLHTDVRVISRRPCRARLFGGWTMAYCGTSGPTQKHIEELLNAGDVLSALSFERLLMDRVAVGRVGDADDAMTPITQSGRRLGIGIAVPPVSRTGLGRNLLHAIGRI